MSTTASLRASLEERKEEGNRRYQKGKLRAAIEAYTDGISLLPTGDDVSSSTLPLASLGAVLLTNRAQAYKSLGDIDAMERDALASLTLDKTNPKASYLLACVALQRDEWLRAIGLLERAAESARRQRKSVTQQRDYDIALADARARWYHASSVAEAACDDVLHVECASALASSGAGEHPIPAHTTPRFIARVPPLDAAGGAAAGDGGAAAPPETRSQRLAAMFAARAALRNSRSVPEGYSCPLSLGVMLDPVLALPVTRTNVAHAYDRGSIAAYLATGKREDPISRVPLSSELIPLLALKQAITEWLAHNPWAHPWLSAEPE